MSALIASPSERRSTASWLLPTVVLLSVGVSVWLAITTVRLRFARDVARLVFNDNSEALEQARLQAGAGTDSLKSELAKVPEAAPGGPYR